MKATPWVVVGPEPDLASCTRCRDRLPKPSLPKPLGAFGRYMQALGIVYHTLGCGKMAVPR